MNEICRCGHAEDEHYHATAEKRCCRITSCRCEWWNPSVPPTPPVVEEMPEWVKKNIAHARAGAHEWGGATIIWLADALQSSQKEQARYADLAGRWMHAAVYATPVNVTDAMDPMSPEAFAESRRTAVDQLMADLQSSQQRAELMQGVVDAALAWSSPDTSANDSMMVSIARNATLAAVMRDYRDRSTQRET